ncbi:MAG: hypothetical protein C3F11_11965 [Methylocystaceae bacterium]|nr:MAG: hypothetical protein C3F11_11965 [Methylocystaceae bacterium]
MHFGESPPDQIRLSNDYLIIADEIQFSSVVTPTLGRIGNAFDEELCVPLERFFDEEAPPAGRPLCRPRLRPSAARRSLGRLFRGFPRASTNAAHRRKSARKRAKAGSKSTSPGRRRSSRRGAACPPRILHSICAFALASARAEYNLKDQ